MPKRPRFTKSVEVVFDQLSDYHGIGRNLASERLHRIKGQFGMRGDTDLVFDYTGNVFHPVTGERIGSLTEGGATRGSKR